MYFITSKAKAPSSTRLLPLYNSCNSFNAVIPKDAVADFNNGSIGSFGFKWPP